ncbi:MAG: UvrD-helicase domain-containing protein, partial [Bacteroidota bacterium]
MSRILPILTASNCVLPVPEQRAAVDRVEGPVLVIAGPGTGKTQLLAVRIGNILLNTDTKA